MTSPTPDTATFLLTDIEGSTRLWEKYPDAMKSALARHDEILRRAIDKHQGRVFKTVGDSFYAVFADARDALAAALAAQRALQAETWQGIDPIRVRMALHTGAAEERDGEYFGPTINRSLSLMYTGHGGQILLSHSTQQLVNDHLPLGAQLRDLGERRLKDLTSAERIFQFVTPDLPADFAPLRTLDARFTNLPAQATALIGRDLEVVAACAFLRREDVRLLTFIGPGGVGKTRLGLQVAAASLEEFQDGVCFVPLGSLSDAGLVGQAIAQALGIRETTGQLYLESLKNYVCDKQLLLLLDNFEHISDAAPLVAELLAKAPRLKILVTSRMALRLPGEHTFPVPPLALPKRKRSLEMKHLSHYAALALFVERARAVKPDLALSNDNVAAIAEICARLDGLPLAIELAAARAKLLSPQAILDRLDRRLALLTGGARNLPARQRTMRDAIAWSYDLLSTDEQTLLRRLAVFAGGCTPEAASAVAAVPGMDISDGLTQLADKSLLQSREGRAEQPRFVMLETIQEYALEQLNASEPDQLKALRQRHAHFFLDLAETLAPQLTSPDPLPGLARLEIEHDNLRAALEWSLAKTLSPPEDDCAGRRETGLRLVGALWWFWYLRGYWSEGRAWLEKALDMADAPSHTAWLARALYGAGELARSQGERDAARRWLDKSLAIWQELGDRLGLAYALMSLGLIHVSHNERAAARAILTESVQLFRDSHDKRGLALAVRGLGTAADPDDFDAARALFEESLALFRETQDRWGQGTPLGNLGFLAYRQGDYATARALYEESLAIFRQIGDKWRMADALNMLGEIARCQGDYERAGLAYNESMALYRELGNKGGVSNQLHNLGYVARRKGDYTQALALFAQGLALERESGRLVGVLFCLAGLAGATALREHSGTPPPNLDRLKQAACILGAVQAQLDALGIMPDPADRTDIEHSWAALRARLDQETLAASRAAGQAMTLEQAIACALELESK